MRIATSDESAYLVGGVLLDKAGDTVALVEMAPGSGCPDDFLPDVRLLNEAAPMNRGIDPEHAPETTAVPHPTAT